MRPRADRVRAESGGRDAQQKQAMAIEADPIRSKRLITESYCVELSSSINAASLSGPRIKSSARR